LRKQSLIKDGKQHAQGAIQKKNDKAVERTSQQSDDLDIIKLDKTVENQGLAT
jgi:hypothetical protein